MNYELLFRRAGANKIKAVMAGAGEFGLTFVFQSLRSRHIDVPVIVNRTVSKGVQAFVNAGVRHEDIAVCESPSAAKENFNNGKRIVVSSIEDIEGLAVDVLVEATGNPEVGAASALTALENGWHVVMVSKEVDSVVGPELSAIALEKKLVYTPGDGDQPSLLIGLISWARTLGFNILGAGKSSEYDFVYDPQDKTVVSNGITIPSDALGDNWELGDRPVRELFEARKHLLAALPQRAVPDLCEMGVVANATGMKPDHPVFHAPVARPVEIPDFICPREMGGLLNHPGTLDIINCLRRPDEASLGGGVFVIVECRDATTWNVLASKGHPVSRNRSSAMLYHPAHLLGAETGTSVLSAAVLGHPTGSDHVRPVCDLVGRAEYDLQTGMRLDMGGHHHTIDGVSAELIDAGPVKDANPLPFYLMANRRLRCDVPSGRLITADMVDMDTDAMVYRLRRLQDRRFFGE